jgi:hypothetical protein
MWLWIERQGRGHIVGQRHGTQLLEGGALPGQRREHQLALGIGERQAGDLLGRRDLVGSNIHSSPRNKPRRTDKKRI